MATPKRRRRQFRELETLRMLLLQPGTVVICPRCRKPITLEDVRGRNVQKEHKHEFGLEGPDEPENCCFSHAAKPCHALVTHGNGATIAGSSRHKIGKTAPEVAEKFKVNKPGPRPRPLTPDRVSQPSGRCPGCGECREACTCARRERRSGFGRRRDHRQSTNNT